MTTAAGPAPGGPRLAFAGGGTGGHLVPGLHLLAAARELAPDAVERPADLLWFTSGRAVEEHVLAELPDALDGLACERVPLALEPRGGGAPSRASLALRALPQTLRARRALKRHRSEVLLGLGGFTSLPAVLAARSLGLPVALLEVNGVPGTATRALARLAARVFHAWRASLPARAGARHVHVGPPLAPALFAPRPAEAERRAAAAALGLGDGPLLLVLGGSQGAGSLNAFVRAHLDALRAGGLEVLHQVGPQRAGEAAEARPGYRAVEFLSPLAPTLRAATLTLCRGGASTLAELAAARLPAVVVPYPHHADRHQERNASELGAGARVVPDEGLDAALAGELARLGGPAGEGERAAMAAALARAVPSGGARAILGALAELARPR